MKKLVILFAGVVLTGTAFSQVSIGIQGIGNLGNAKFTADELSSYDKTMKAMPGAGVVADIQLTDKVAIRTGINFLQTGVQIKATQDGEAGEIDKIHLEATTKLNYLQIPLNLMYTSSGSAIKFFAGAGPYFSYGISGKLKSTATTHYSSGETEVEKDESDAFKKVNGESLFKRTDIGVGAIAGVKFPNGMFANVGYQYSLANINKGEGSYKSRGLQLTVGYFFWRK